MAPYTYYITFFIILTLLLLENLSNWTKILVSCLFIGLISSLRFNFGADYSAYQMIYNVIMSSQSAIFGIEPLYSFYNQITQTLGLNYIGFIVFNTVTLLALIVLWILMSTNHHYRSFFVYMSFFFLVWNLSTFRQAMALSLGVFFLFNKRINTHLLIKLLIVPILAMFHVSAWFFGVLLIVGSIPWKKYYHVVFFIVSLVFTLLPSKEIITSVIYYNGLDVFTNIVKLRYYFNGMEFSSGFMNINAIMRIFFFGLVWVHYDLLTTSKYLKRMTDIFLVGMSLYLFLSFNALIASRLTIYALFLLVILLPEILSYYEDKQKWKRILAMSVFVSLCTFMYFKDLYAIKKQLGIDDGKWYVEYQSILDQPITE